MKKIVLIFSALLLALPFSVLGANFVQISDDFIAGAIAYIDDIAVGILPLLAVFVGIPLAFWVIGKVIELPEKGLKK